MGEGRGRKERGEEASDSGWQIQSKPEEKRQDPGLIIRETGTPSPGHTPSPGAVRAPGRAWGSAQV